MTAEAITAAIHVKEILETGQIQSEVKGIQEVLPEEEEPEDETSEVPEDTSEEDLGRGPSPAGAPA